MLQFLHTATAAAALASAAPVAARHGSVELIASTDRPRPGSTILVGFRMKPDPGWHGYWSNPGESGLSPTVKWSAPAKLHFGPLRHPAPTLLRTMGLVSFVHAGEHTLVARVRVDRDVAPSTPLPVRAELNWANCSATLCVPEHAVLTLPLTVGDGRPSANASLLAAALAREPRPAGSGIFWVKAGRLTLELPRSAAVNPRPVRFFPDRNGFFDAARAQVVAQGPVRIAAPLRGEAPSLITGVVSDGARAYRLSFRRGAEPAEHLSQPAAARAEKAAGPGGPPAAAPPSPAPSAPAAPAAAPVRDGGREWLFALLALAGLSFGALFLAWRRRR